MDSSLRQRSDQLQRKVKQLLNADLKSICKSEGLPVSGVKATLQTRINERISDISEDPGAFNRLYDTINQYGTPLPGADNSHSAQSAQMPKNPTAYTPGPYTNGSGSSRPTQTQSKAGRLNFKASPFYTIQEPITNAIEFKVTATERGSSESSFRLSQAMIDRLKQDQSMKIMLYCAMDPGSSSYPIDITFPSATEVKTNEETYTGNLRGIKKKPGTTRPADITPFLRKNIGFTNKIHLAYATSDKSNFPSTSKYLYAVYLVKKHTVDELVNKIKVGKKIAKQQVLSEMKAKASDPDIVATSTVMSLKCPLSTMRMQIPCRGINCNHNQCFDAMSFLQTQEQAPQWSCPTCNKPCRFEDLVVDEYVQDILSRTSAEQVTIEPTGEWRQGTGDARDKKVQEFAKPSTNFARATPVHEIDDPIEITSDSRPNGHHRAESASTTSYFQTPASSRAPSVAASAGPKSLKRKADDVIDLTFDDDDDDTPPQRPVKRQSTIPSFPSVNTNGNVNGNVIGNGVVNGNGNHNINSNGYAGFSGYPTASPAFPPVLPAHSALSPLTMPGIPSPASASASRPPVGTGFSFQIPSQQQQQQSSNFNPHNLGPTFGQYGWTR